MGKAEGGKKYCKYYMGMSAVVRRLLDKNGDVVVNGAKLKRVEVVLVSECVCQTIAIGGRAVSHFSDGRKFGEILLALEASDDSLGKA